MADSPYPDSRPAWVKDVERTPDGVLLVIEGKDGKLGGVRVPSRSMWEVATNGVH